MHASSVLTALGVTAAAVALTTTVASAAPARPATGSSLANTTQSISYNLKPNGTYAATATIVFATKTFAVTDYGDKGKFTNSGTTLTMQITKGGKGDGDKGCTFTATYDASSTDYLGKYTCPGGVHHKFLVTTSGT